jgi:hypothetical protein
MSRAVAATLLTVAAAGVAAAAVTGVLAGPGAPDAQAAGSGPHTATAAVTRRTLQSQTSVTATWGDAGSYSVVNQAQGTLTRLPAIGAVIREGRALYSLDGGPVVLLYGPVPAYRSLSEGMTGRDVAELNAALVRLGYASRGQPGPRSGYFGQATAFGIEKLQARLGVPVTGALTLGQAVFLPGPARITALGAGVVPGALAQPGATILTATSTRPAVTINLDASQRTEVRRSDRVAITLPSGRVTPGTIASVGTVATVAPGASTPTVVVQVTPVDPRAGRGLESAPVTVAITTGILPNALTVPVTALLARSAGGYAVEVAGAGDGRRLIPVTLSLADSAAGLVAVSGPGLAAGQRVVVPAL